MTLLRDSTAAWLDNVSPDAKEKLIAAMDGLKKSADESGVIYKQEDTEMEEKEKEESVNEDAQEKDVQEESNTEVKEEVKDEVKDEAKDEENASESAPEVKELKAESNIDESNAGAVEGIKEFLLKSFGEIADEIISIKEEINTIKQSAQKANESQGEKNADEEDNIKEETPLLSFVSILHKRANDDESSETDVNVEELLKDGPEETDEEEDQEESFFRL